MLFILLPRGARSALDGRRKTTAWARSSRQGREPHQQTPSPKALTIDRLLVKNLREIATSTEQMRIPRGGRGKIGAGKKTKSASVRIDGVGGAAFISYMRSRLLLEGLDSLVPGS